MNSNWMFPNDQCYKGNQKEDSVWLLFNLIGLLQLDTFNIVRSKANTELQMQKYEIFPNLQLEDF